MVIVYFGSEFRTSHLPRIPSRVSSMKVAQLERGAYASLRQFIHGVEDTARLDTPKAGRGRGANPRSSNFVFFAQEMVQVQRHEGDSAVQWVLKGQEREWLAATGSAPIA